MENKEIIVNLLDRLYISSAIPFHVFDADGTIIIQTGTDNTQNDPFYTDEKLWNKVKEGSQGKSIPVIYMEAEVFIYGSFFDKEGYYYICGPIALAKLSVSKNHYFREQHGGKREDIIPVKTYMSVANMLSLAFGVVTGQWIAEQAILTSVDEKTADERIESKDVDKYHFEKSENAVQHLSYQYEQQYLAAVEKGDVDFFKTSYAADPNAMEKIGKLADNNSKQMEYMCLSSIVLVTRAAMRGGLNPQEVYALSELYMQKLERCKSIQEILNLHNIMRIDFVTRVKSVQERKVKKDYIEKCKNYITHHVHYPIKIKEIADIIGVNHSYLSRQFTKQEGVTIVQYYIKTRLHAAANMLKYSETNIADISDYFCFASQSRFGTQFKKEFGVTPHIYRKENQVIDFVSKV